MTASATTLTDLAAYSTRDVARLLRLPVDSVRAFARAGFVASQSRRGAHYRFSFQDVVVIRAAKALSDSGVPSRRLWRALRELRRQLPGHRSLAAIRIVSRGKQLLARDGRAVWQPGSGQLELDFGAARLAEAGTLVRRDATWNARAPDARAEDWFDLGVDLELAQEHAEAAEAYRRALEIDDGLADAWINLGRLDQAAGNPEAAARRYQRALRLAPGHAVAAFNLGTALDDLGRVEEALRAYDLALATDPDFADAHFNVGRLEEQRGNAEAALRHLSRYRALTEGES